MHINRYEIRLARHAFKRAVQRGIDPSLVEDALKTGRQERFGKNKIKFVKKFRKFTIVCVDEIKGRAVKIVTIERVWK